MYFHDYKIPDIDDYCSELEKKYSISDVQKSNLDKNQKHYLYSTNTDF